MYVKNIIRSIFMFVVCFVICFYLKTNVVCAETLDVTGDVVDVTGDTVDVADDTLGIHDLELDVEPAPSVISDDGVDDEIDIDVIKNENMLYIIIFLLGVICILCYSKKR